MIVCVSGNEFIYWHFNTVSCIYTAVNNDHRCTAFVKVPLLLWSKLMSMTSDKVELSLLVKKMFKSSND